MPIYLNISRNLSCSIEHVISLNPKHTCTNWYEPLNTIPNNLKTLELARFYEIWKEPKRSFNIWPCLKTIMWHDRINLYLQSIKNARHRLGPQCNPNNIFSPLWHNIQLATGGSSAANWLMRKTYETHTNHPNHRTGLITMNKIWELWQIWKLDKYLFNIFIYVCDLVNNHQTNHICIPIWKNYN